MWRAIERAALHGTMRLGSAASVCLVLLVTAPSSAQEQSGTLQLDADSLVSFGEYQNVPIPAGGTVRLHFGAPGADGAIPITVRPGDVSIPPIPVAEGATIQYALVSDAFGTLRKLAGRREIELFATLMASLRETPGAAPIAYQLRFTTGTAQATNAAGSESVALDGAPVRGSNRVQLVGAATNRPDAFPGPGEAVYAILSGSFDWLPGGP